MAASKARIRFADFVIDVRSREVFRRGRPVMVQHLPLQLLIALASRPGEVVTRDELRRTLWPEGVHVDHEAGLNTAVRKLRDALGDDASSPRFVETVPRIGYRFVGELRTRQLRPAAWASSSAAAVLLGLVLLWPTDGRRPELPIDERARSEFVDGRYYKARHRLLEAVSAFERAASLEPSHARTWAELGESRAILWFVGGRSGNGSVESARAAIEEALRLNADEPAALRAAGLLALHHDWDFARAGTLLERAVALDPGSPESQLATATWLSVTGRHDEAILRVRAAIELDPASYAVKSDAGYFLLRAGRVEEAIDECERALRLAPDFTPARSCLVEASFRTGDEAAHRRHARALLEARGATPQELIEFDDASDPRREVARWQLTHLEEDGAKLPLQRAALHATLGDRATALRWLQTAYESRDPLLVFVSSNSALAVLAGDARFDALLRRIGLSA